MNPAQPQQNQQNQMTRSDRIESAIDKNTTGALAINRHGQITFVNANEIMEFAKMMALAKQAIPPHLRDNPGGCMAVCIQASSWQMSPFAVANKSYVVNDRMAYESAIIAAVIIMRAPIKGRLKYTYSGKEGTRQCTCTAILDDGETVDYTTPEIRNIKVQNSPLWKNDPDQQLAYSAARSLARRHFPDVILGVYTPEEMAEETTVRDVTPIPGRPSIGTDTPKTIEADPAAPKAEALQQKPQPEQKRPAPKKAKNEVVTEAEPVQEEQQGQEEQPAGETTGAEEPPAKVYSEPERVKLFEEVNGMRDNAGLSMADFKKRMGELQIIEPSQMLNKYPGDVLEEIKRRWDEVIAKPAAE